MRRRQRWREAQKGSETGTTGIHSAVEPCSPSQPCEAVPGSCAAAGRRAGGARATPRRASGQRLHLTQCPSSFGTANISGVPWLSPPLSTPASSPCTKGLSFPSLGICPQETVAFLLVSPDLVRAFSGWHSGASEELLPKCFRVEKTSESKMTLPRCLHLFLLFLKLENFVQNFK